MKLTIPFVLLLSFCCLAESRHAWGQYELHVDPNSFEAFITNIENTNSLLDVYELRSEPPVGLLDPNGWISLESQGFSSFREIGTVTPRIIAELNPGPAAIFAPNQMVSIGFPLGANGEAIPALGGDARFFFSFPGVLSAIEGPIVLLPEPSAFALVSLALIGTACRRRFMLT